MIVVTLSIISLDVHCILSFFKEYRIPCKQQFEILTCPTVRCISNGEMPYKINFILALKILTLNDIGRVSDFENETFTIKIQTINITNV